MGLVGRQIRDDIWGSCKVGLSEPEVGAVGPTQKISIRYIGKGLVSSVKKVLLPPTTDKVDWRIFNPLSLPKLMHELCCFFIS